MADNPLPNPPSGPTGAVPPPKKETGKVQPKKETVRINLPPKPTAAPTIKLPTLPPGGPTGAPSQAPALAITHTAAPPPRAAGAPGTSTGKGGASGAQQRPGTMQQRQAAPAAPSIKMIDKALVYVATVAALAAAGMNFYVFYFVLKPLVETFQQ
jgi:hypothetical protein